MRDRFGKHSYSERTVQAKRVSQAATYASGVERKIKEDSDRLGSRNFHRGSTGKEQSGLCSVLCGRCRFHLLLSRGEQAFMIAAELSAKILMIEIPVL
jgi:hypothetical protein